MPVGFKTGPKNSVGHKPEGYEDEETDPEETSDLEKEHRTRSE